ncbi:MAG: DNA cytosine methyltransferase [Clostridia bacterium]|nr:DNA cytosine methyltransferase [Clostridia bacterium]
MRIRKITSKEAWRLMGFNDEDYEKAKMVCCETSLYHQAGNSIVVNVIYEILKKLF